MNETIEAQDYEQTQVDECTVAVIYRSPVLAYNRGVAILCKQNTYCSIQAKECSSV